jgi:hypothetical protein
MDNIGGRYKRANLKDWLLAFEKKHDEQIEAVVIGGHPDHPLGEPATMVENVVSYSRSNWIAKLDYEFDSGFGCAGCHPITAWTKSFVIFIFEYDGATQLMHTYRNPTDHEPDFNCYS